MTFHESVNYLYQGILPSNVWLVDNELMFVEM